VCTNIYRKNKEDKERKEGEKSQCNTEVIAFRAVSCRLEKLRKK
jgi:hypothetical protein